MKYLIKLKSSFLSSQKFDWKRHSNIIFCAKLSWELFFLYFHKYAIKEIYCPVTSLNSFATASVKMFYAEFEYFAHPSKQMHAQS